MCQPFAREYIDCLIVLAVILALAQAQIVNNDAGCSFPAFVSQYTKIYSSQEQYTKREAIFLQNCQNAQKSLSSGSGVSLAINQYSDLTAQELQKLAGGKTALQQQPAATRVGVDFNLIAPPPASSTSSNTSSSTSSNASTNTSSNTSANTAANTPSNTSSNTTSNTSANTSTNTPTNTPADTSSVPQPPTQLNYASSLLMSQDDKTMGICNNSWAIGAAYLYESYLLSFKYFNYTAEAAIVGCTQFYAPNSRPNDCKAGNVEDALLFLTQVGTVAKTSYPNITYTSPNASAPVCRDNNRIFISNGSVVTMEGAADSVIQGILFTSGPVAAKVYANYGFLTYNTGLFECTANSSGSPNLTVVVYGYKNNTWLIRAPFGVKWGIMGTMTLSMANNCGLNTSISYIDFGLNPNQPYGFSSINYNVNQVLDPTTKFNAIPSKNSESAMKLCMMLLLLALAMAY